MADLGWVPALLPSRGLLNPHPDTGEPLIEGGEVQIRKLKTREESILMSQGAEGLERFDIILKNCTRIPNGVKPLDLLITDRMALILALRTHTFGPEYSFNFKCQFCNQMGKYNLNIMDELQEKDPVAIAERLYAEGKIDAPEDYKLEEPFEVNLEECGKIIRMRFLRGHDEKKIASRSKRMMMQSNDPTDPSYIYRMALQVVTVDGEKKPLAEMERWVRELDGGDSARMRIALDDIEPGIDIRVYPTCRSCSATNEMGMPFSAEFFRPSSIGAGNARNV